MNMRNRGFTLIELIVVMIITGVLAGGLVVFLRSAFTNYMNVANRARLTDMADTAMRLMQRDIRLAVPNSVRTSDTACVELIPTSTGGRYRSAPDSTDGASQAVDTSTDTVTFDVVSPMTPAPAVGDWVVVANQNTNDVYTNNVNRSQISALPAIPTNLGKYRITLNPALRFPAGYDNSRFVVVPDSQKAVFYRCDNAGLDPATGTGTGTLYRFSNYGFNAAPTACKALDGSEKVVAKNVSQCRITLNPNAGAIQGAGYVEVQLQFSVNKESVDLLFGAHTDNLP